MRNPFVKNGGAAFSGEGLIYFTHRDKLEMHFSPCSRASSQKGARSRRAVLLGQAYGLPDRDGLPENPCSEVGEPRPTERRRLAPG